MKTVENVQTVILSRKQPDLYPWNAPMPIVKVAGDYREIGFKHGQQTKDLIQRAVRNAWATLPTLIGMGKSDVVQDLNEYEQKIRASCNGFSSEMEGVAAGATVSYEDIVLLNSQYDLLIMRGGEKALQSLLCSAFAAWGSATKKGEIIGGHNDDGGRFTDQFLVLLDAKPVEGHRFLVPIVPGQLGYHAVINSSGFCAFGNSLEIGPKPEEAKIGVPMWAIFRHLVQFESNVNSALRYLERVESGITVSVLLLDKDGRAAVAHKTPNNFAIVKPTSSHLCVTNHALTNEIRDHLVTRNRPSSTYYRLESIEKSVNDNLGKIDADAAMRIMSTHYDVTLGKDMPSMNTPCRHGEYEGKLAGTCRSAVVRLAKKQLSLRVALGNPCVAKWIEVRLAYEH
jgi:isopenicillin-N N-acyltransferase-like protein